MSRSAQERISDLLLAIERCARYVEMLDSEDSTLADMAGDAIERNLQVIGEAVKHLPDELTGQNPEINWPQIRGFRNILVHQYFGVDAATVRDVVENHLPPLASVVRGWQESLSHLSAE